MHFHTNFGIRRVEYVRRREGFPGFCIEILMAKLLLRDRNFSLQLELWQCNKISDVRIEQISDVGLLWAKVRRGGGFCTEVLMESKIEKILISKINFVNSRVSAILTLYSAIK